MTQAGTKQERTTATTGPDPSSAVLQATGTTTLPERQFAATSWLLGAADDRDTARRQWDEQGIALLCCGGILSAVRIPARIVWAAAKSDELGKVDAFLARWFDGGAAFMDLHAQRYYALVPGTAGWRLRERDFPGVCYLGRDNFLGVPASRITEPKGRGYWCLPMQSPGDLCYPDEVELLVLTGRAALGERGGW